MINEFNDVQAIKNGNKIVFEKIYQELHQPIYFFVLKRTSSKYLAEEVVQRTFIKLWEKRTGLSDNFPISVQVARIARSLFIDSLRKQATERKVLEIIKSGTYFSEIIGYTDSRELQVKLDRRINELPGKCREIFILSRDEGLSYSEIAEKLSISPRTVENQISKALKILRKVVALLAGILFLIQPV